MVRLKFLALLSVIVILFLGMSVSQSSGIEKPKPTKNLLALGKDVYSEKCAICHGEKGDAKGEVAIPAVSIVHNSERVIFSIYGRIVVTDSIPTKMLLEVHKDSAPLTLISFVKAFEKSLMSHCITPM